MKSKFKAPGTERLILKYDRLLSRRAFKFKLRLYIPDEAPYMTTLPGGPGDADGSIGLGDGPVGPAVKPLTTCAVVGNSGVIGRGLHSST
jgi:hypothetical protein